VLFALRCSGLSDLILFCFGGICLFGR